MRLVSYLAENACRIGAVVDDRVVDLNEYLPDDQQLPSDMTEFLALGESGLERARESLRRFSEANQPGTKYSEVQLLPPVPRPGKIICVGRNYAAHIEELRAMMDVSTPPFPRIFAKYPSSLVGHREDVIYPPLGEQIDFEGELTLVIGKRARNVSEDDVWDYIAGYTIVNDMTARDLQVIDELTLAKNFETFAPAGPWIITRDEIPDPHALTVRTWLNDRLVSEANTRDMIYKIPTIISFLSEAFPLEPGDIITTGSPPGVGAFHNPPLFVQPGDVMRIEIEGVGVLENRMTSAV